MRPAVLRSLTRLGASHAAGAAVVTITAATRAGPRFGMPWLATRDAAGRPALTAPGALLLAVPGAAAMCPPQREPIIAAGIATKRLPTAARAGRRRSAAAAPPGVTAS